MYLVLFLLDEDSKYAVCNDCKQKVSGGGATTKTCNNTSNLVSHLKTKHPELYKKFESHKAQEMEEPTISTSTKDKQLTPFESKDRVCVWDIGDPRAQCVHRLIREMIAIGTQPFSVVEDEASPTF